MPAEAWFPTVIFYEDLVLPAAVHADALAAVDGAVDQERLAAVRRYTAIDAPNTLHHDTRMAPLLKMIGESARRYIVDVLHLDTESTRFFIGRCWPVVQQAGGAGGLHCHGGATISGVFYLDTPPGSGGLEFKRPFTASYDHLAKTGDSELTFEHVTYQPLKHRVLLFASNLNHRALPDAEDIATPRIAIAFDIYAMCPIEHPTGGLPHFENLLPL